MFEEPPNAPCMNHQTPSACKNHMDLSRSLLTSPLDVKDKLENRIRASAEVAKLGRKALLAVDATSLEESETDNGIQGSGVP